MATFFPDVAWAQNSRGNRHDPSCPLDERTERRLHLPLAGFRLAGHVTRDVQVQPLDLPVMKAVRAASRENLPSLRQQPRCHPPRVPQKRGIGGIVNVGFHHRCVGADDVGADHFFRNSILAKQFVDPSPRLGPDDEKALVQKRVVHYGPLSHSQEVLEERITADANDRLAERQPFEVLYDQGPQDVLRGVVALPPVCVSLGKLQQIFVDGRKDLGIVVEDLTDRPVSGTIVPYDLGQPVIAALKAQHGFHFPTHPCSPMWSQP